MAFSHVDHFFNANFIGFEDFFCFHTKFFQFLNVSSLFFMVFKTTALSVDFSRHFGALMFIKSGYTGLSHPFLGVGFHQTPLTKSVSNFVMLTHTGFCVNLPSH